MEFWNTTLASLSVDGRGSYGIGASAVERSDNLYTYLRITDIRDDGTLNMADLKSVDDAKASQYLLRPNDIVFARTGASTGRNYFYDGTDGEFVYAGFLIKFNIDPGKVNPNYRSRLKLFTPICLYVMPLDNGQMASFLMWRKSPWDSLPKAIPIMRMVSELCSSKEEVNLDSDFRHAACSRQIQSAWLNQTMFL